MPDKIARWAPTITAGARPYLKIQQGRISDFEGAAWDRAYADQLNQTADAIEPWLPRPLTSILDVGAGMGGIDALLAHRYGTANTKVVLLDGLDDDPVVREHNQTYSNGGVAIDFLRANGLWHITNFAYSPGDKINEDACLPKVDLVLSVQAWGFHFEPRLYCKAAMALSRPGTRWILDVRADNAPWAAYLFATPKLRPLDEIAGFTDKYTRMIFEVEE